MENFRKYIDASLGELEQDNLLREPRIIERYKGPFVTICGKEYICFASNDYLGFAQHPKLVEAVKSALNGWGWGAGSSRLLSGTTIWHDKLEKKIAGFKQAEAAIYFSSGYMANLGLITSIADRETLIVEDRLNHASLIDATRLSNAKVLRYQHRSVQAVADILNQNRKYKRRFIVTDAVFSMDGDIAPLAELIPLSEEFDAEIVIDDAHGTGILGKEGRGTLEHLGLEGKINITVVTLSKAIGSTGGAVVGSNRLIQLLRNRARSFIFTTSTPPAICAAGIAGIELIQSESSLRQKLWENVSYLRKELLGLGFDIRDSETPIIPIVIGTAENALKVSNFLWERGIFAPAIRPPTVPEGESRIRISLTALHEREHLDKLVEAITEIKRRFL